MSWPHNEVVDRKAESHSSLSSCGNYEDVCKPPPGAPPIPQPKRKVSLSHLPFITQPQNEQDIRCGWCGFRPAFLERFEHPRYVLLVLCCMVFLQGLVVNGTVYMVLPTIERRFQLKSFETGSAISMYYMASCISAPIVTLVASKRSKPTYLAMATIVIGIGTMVLTIPHFMAPRYRHSLSEDDLCPAQHQDAAICASARGNLRTYRYVFWLGHLIMGAGSSPMYTLALTYLDENLPTTLSTRYIAIYHATSLLGTASGFVLCGYILNIYTDWAVDASKHGLTADSKVWVGAWWLGYLIGSALSFIVALPISLLPKQLPCRMWAQLEERCDAVTNKSKSLKHTNNDIKHLPSNVVLLLRNPTFVFICLAGTTETMIITGLATFITKVFESQLGLTTSVISKVLGCVAVPSACAGILLGGLCVNKYNLSIEGIIRMCLISSVIPWFTSFIFLFHCPNLSFFGLNHTSSRFLVNNVTTKFDQSCNAYCGCPIENYNPVCGKDKSTYFSPCFAGCRRDYIFESFKVYTDCECINHEGESFIVNTGTTERVQADRKKCHQQCDILPSYIVGMILYMFATFLTYTPGLSATIRCVDQDLKGIALGFQWTAVIFLGAFPASAVFGYGIDNSCILWNSVCEKAGACAVHDNEVMARNLFTATIVLKTLSVLFFTNALIFTTPEADKDVPAGGSVEYDSSSAVVPLSQGRRDRLRRASVLSLY
ncbi:solute carrier organic anion transporter family member 4A1-like [Ornithodoros turicata]|uniref:solute carrier organic anion transporter family member 4A1-like n=1 Tax=Ornithodoros turicata TaxID=34597 RepID=UPI003139A258